MLGKIIGAIAGGQAAKHARNVNGPAGAILGAAAVAMARRLGPAGLVAAAAGGYALKRFNEKQNRHESAAASTAGRAR